MPRYTVTEPHPTVLQNAYTHSGRGGAGNFFRAPATTSSTGVPTTVTAPTTSKSTRFYSGRGGAGNAHASVERPVLSFDEEFSRAEVREKTSTLTHVGRGGAGNVFGSTSGGSTKSIKSRRDSASTSGSVRSGFWARLNNVGSHQN